MPLWWSSLSGQEFVASAGSGELSLQPRGPETLKGTCHCFCPFSRSGWEMQFCLECGPFLRCFSFPERLLLPMESLLSLCEICTHMSTYLCIPTHTCTLKHTLWVEAQLNDTTSVHVL